MKFILALAVTIALMVIINQRELPGGEEAVSEVAEIEFSRDPIDGEIMVTYKMGQSQHFIRHGAVNAVVFTPQRQTIIFEGGKLSTNITKEQFRAAAQKFLLEDGK